MSVAGNICVLVTLMCCVLLSRGFTDTMKQTFPVGTGRCPWGCAQGLSDVPWGNRRNSLWNLKLITFGLVSKSYLVLSDFSLLEVCLCCSVFLLCSVPSFMVWEEDSTWGVSCCALALVWVLKAASCFTPAHACVKERRGWAST